jgi:CO dehydrogenase maturation factor
MKIAVSGKGGVGKTTISGTIAMILAGGGKRVLAVDSDPSMNLHSALGLENPTPVSELKELIAERTVLEGGAFKLNPKVDDIPERYASKSGNLSLLVMGTVEKGGSGCICPEAAFLKALLRYLVLKKDEFLILDTEAGIEHLGRNIAAKFDLMIVVCEPSEKAVDTARRVHKLSKEIGIRRVVAVANKIANQAQEDFIKKALDFELIGSIPFDNTVIEADMNRRPLYTYPDSQALESIQKITEQISSQG